MFPDLKYTFSLADYFYYFYIRKIGLNNYLFTYLGKHESCLPKNIYEVQTLYQKQFGMSPDGKCITQE